MNKNIIIFTDLDGTLLDSKYSFEKAKPALKLIKKKKIPLILCSSKTKTEIEYYRKKLKNTHPFISENGGGIFIPKKYFNFKISSIRDTYLSKTGFHIEDQKKYIVIQLSNIYPELRKAIKDFRKNGLNVLGFGDMSIKEVSNLTGLKSSEAKMSKQRDFDEPFVFKGNKNSMIRLKQLIKSKALTYTQGEFYHLMGNSDKGRAVELLKKLYVKQKGEIITIALGDNPNDREMLKSVDHPVIVRKPDGTYCKNIRIKKLIRTAGTGPSGWNSAVTKLLVRYGTESESCQ